MNEEKPKIYFFSASSEMFDTIEDAFFEKWNFHLFKLSPFTKVINLEETPDLIILDTLSLKLDLLEQIKKHPKIGNCPVLVVDNYTEQVLIDKIVEKGASAYLHVDKFIDNLSQKVHKIIYGRMLHSIFI